MKKRIILFMLIMAVFLSNLSIQQVFADEARVTDIDFSTQTDNSHTILNITVLHHNYYPGHFVNSIEVNIAGTVYTVAPNPTQPLNQPFFVQYDMGVVTGTPTVSARAICNIHGSAGDSDPIVVPEFSTITITVTLLALSLMILKLRSRDSIKM